MIEEQPSYVVKDLTSQIHRLQGYLHNEKQRAEKAEAERDELKVEVERLNKFIASYGMEMERNMFCRIERMKSQTGGGDV